MYGPTKNKTASTIAFDGNGQPASSWDCGLPKGTLPLRPPKIIVDVETPEGLTASVMLPGGVSRLLVDDTDRELVREHHGILNGPGLPAVLGAYLVTEQRSDGMVVYELVVHNGLVPWRGCLRFRKLRVRVVTLGWTATPIGLNAVQAGDYYFGVRTALTARWVCYQNTAQTNAAMGLANRAGLKIPDPVPCIGAARFSLPRLLGSQQDKLGNAPTIGYFHYDDAYTGGDNVGGAGINPIGGWEGSEGAAMSYAADVSRLMARHGVAVSQWGGDPLWPELWSNHWQYKLYDGRYEVDPWNWSSTAGTIVGEFGWKRPGGPREANPGPSSSRAQVLKYAPHDMAHLIRVVHRALAAWQLTRSWAARWLLRMNACDVMTSFDVQGSLGGRLNQARAQPGRGGEYLRELAWAGESVAAALSLTPSGVERSRYLAWRAMYLEYNSLICLANGFARDGHGSPSGGSNNGEPWQLGLPVEYGASAVFQLAFFVHMLWDLYENGPDLQVVPRHRLGWLMTRGEDNIRFLLPLVGGSPPTYVGTTRNGIVEDPIKLGTADRSYSGHFEHDHHALALGWLATKDPKWKKAIYGIGRAHANPAAQLAWFKANVGPWTALPIAVGGAT